MNLVSVINFFLIAGVVQGFTFILITIFVKKKFQKAIVFLNLVVFFISLNNLQAWLIEYDFIPSNFFISKLQLPWYLLIFPMFYAFSTHFLRIEKEVNDFVKLTLLVFVFELILRLSLISAVYYYVPNRNDALIKKYENFEEIFNVLFCLFIFFKASILIFKKNDLVSPILAYDNLNWLKWFIRFGSVLMILWIVAVIISNINGSMIAYYPLRLGDSILLYWIAYQGVYKYNVVQDRIILRNSIEAGGVLIFPKFDDEFSEGQTNSQNKKHIKEYEVIEKYIIESKYYLDPLLSMEKLSYELGMSKSHFSKLINSYSNYNFSDFINSLRVEQAKEILSNDEFASYTMVAIGLECGFNSKSTFYSAFKKFTSETPSSYREKH